ncbi:MAG: 4-(cytidine 5'-diphospho)-2-C-methyl-D-erythritol kinase [Omnitrophica bacterium RIFCSPLOWO2_02_FULL_44_11]|nr:MAG: 4-(cytidine 5'-diphospho)-2-C-methyl-D-erythritol kinase [Omnitrophica bacterium RIFCSPLOWO2_02_FULL_44_11]
MRLCACMLVRLMKSIFLLSPAKINLHLAVLGKRPDGYHEIFTLFHRISIFDELILKKCSEGGNCFKLSTQPPEIIPFKKNIIYKAYRLLRKAVSWKGGVHITLHKKIPVQAGLGGGSSNAAYFLLGMNELFGLGLSLKTLCELGQKLGADVPFFLHKVNQAIGRGRGDRIQPVPFKEKMWITLIIPNFYVSTKEAYQSLQKTGIITCRRARLTRINHAVTITSVLSKQRGKHATSVILRNDLFEASCLVQPKLKEIDFLLASLSIKNKLMSGSGSAMFCLHRTKKEAERIGRQIKKRKPKFKVFSCHTY